MALKAIRVNLWEEVGADVTRDKARMSDDFSQERNVVGHTWKENDPTLEKWNPTNVVLVTDYEHVLHLWSHSYPERPPSYQELQLV